MYRVLTSCFFVLTLLAYGSRVAGATEGAKDAPPPAAGPEQAAPTPPSGPKSAPSQSPPAVVKPQVTLRLNVDLSSQQVTVVEGGKVRAAWPISSGQRGFPTPTGNFQPQWTAKLHLSTQYDDAPMPHAVFFNRGIAFHGTSDTRRLGSPASHGCVRLAPSHAARLYALVHKHGLSKTRVAVRGTPRYGGTAVASYRERDSYRDRDSYRERESYRERDVRTNSRQSGEMRWFKGVYSQR